jgi:hypothetical protein
MFCNEVALSFSPLKGERRSYVPRLIRIPATLRHPGYERGYEVTARGIDVQGHVTSVMHTPVGVDADRVSHEPRVVTYSLVSAFP